MLRWLSSAKRKPGRGVRTRNLSPKKRLPLICAAVLLLLSSAFLWIQSSSDPDICFIDHGRTGFWIMYPSPLTTLKRSGPHGAIVRFSKDFFLDELPASVFLHLKACRHFQVLLNGIPVRVPFPANGNWKKEVRVDISRLLRPGNNSLRVDVQNPAGPQLLHLFIEGLKDPIRTDDSWRAGNEEGEAQAILADDTRMNPESYSFTTSREFHGAKIKIVTFLFVVMTAMFLVGRILALNPGRAVIPAIPLCGVTVFWIFLFFYKMVRLPPILGFDADGHLEYIAYIIGNHSLPTASEGWSMFHPPFFYLVSVGALKVLKPLFPMVNSLILLKGIPFLCGLGNIWVAHTLGRQLFPNEPARQFVATLFSGILPMNIYLSALVGNEPLHAFLAGCSVLLTVQMLRSEKTKFSRIVALGIFLSLAILSKVTALVMVPVILFFLAGKMIGVEGMNLLGVAKRVCLLLLFPAALCGWYFIGNLVNFGQLLVINWHLPGQMWWQDPGFHTINYYLGFGDSLRHPYFSGFHSFWDGIYSSLWGDGYISGAAFLRDRPAVWNYQFMSIGYLVAIPATFILIAGVWRAVSRILGEEDIGSRLVWSFLVTSIYVLGFFVLYSTLKVPIYAQAKAFYGLAAMGALSILFALGFGWIDDFLARLRLWPARAALYGWFSTLIVVLSLAFGA